MANGLREHGLRVGALDPGPANTIADVASIGVGHVTVDRDEPDPPDGTGVARTGVTAIVPGDPATLRERSPRAGAAVLNGAGELSGYLQLMEWGVLQTPVYLTATMSVGRVYDGAISAAIAADPVVGDEHVVIPVVGECDDSWLNDARTVQVEAADAGRALAAASADVEQGAVGAGRGMICFDWKGGIGSSSRVTGEGHTVGVVVLTNFGSWVQLRVDGVPVGRLLGRGGDAEPAHPEGSCIAVVATDAPAGSADLCRIARRAGLGLARTGSIAGHGSGEIFMAFSVAEQATLPAAELSPLFAATVEATEEAVLNSLWHAETVTGRDGRVVEALPHDETLELLRRHGRL